MISREELDGYGLEQLSLPLHKTLGSDLCPPRGRCRLGCTEGTGDFPHQDLLSCSPGSRAPQLPWAGWEGDGVEMLAGNGGQIRRTAQQL